MAMWFLGTVASGIASSVSALESTTMNDLAPDAVDGTETDG